MNLRMIGFVLGRILLTEAGLYMKIIGATGSEGTILATRQLPEAGENVEQGTVVEVEFSDLGARD